VTTEKKKNEGKTGNTEGAESRERISYGIQTEVQKKVGPMVRGGER